MPRAVADGIAIDKGKTRAKTAALAMTAVGRKAPTMASDKWRLSLGEGPKTISRRATATGAYVPRLMQTSHVVAAKANPLTRSEALVLTIRLALGWDMVMVRRTRVQNVAVMTRQRASGRQRQHGLLMPHQFVPPMKTARAEATAQARKPAARI